MKKPCLALALALVLGHPAGASDVTTLVTGIEASGDVSVGPDGFIYASHFGPKIRTSLTGMHVLRISPRGEVTTYADGFLGASGNEWDSNGNLYQSSIRGDRVDRVRPNGNVEVFTQAIGGPVGIAVDSFDNVYVASCGGNSIHRYAPDGTGGRFALHSDMDCPNGLTIDPDGNLYAANFNSGKVFRITPEGNAEFLAETPSSDFGPRGGNGHIAYANGRLYVTSWATNQIFEIQMNGTIRPFAGDGSRGHADGPADQARFSWPNGIAVSRDEKLLYISESEETEEGPGSHFDFPLSPNRIRVIELDQAATMPFNLGHTGSWYDPANDGQGFSVEVVPATTTGEPDLLVVYWFTFAPGQPGGVNRQRWFQAVGPITDGEATMEVFRVTGGVFNDPTPVDSRVIGTATMQVDSCMSGSFDYELDLNEDGDPDTAGSISLQRLTPDVTCENLVAQQG